MSAAEPSLASYYAEARSWESERVASGERLARRAWWVAGAGWIAAVSCAIAGMSGLFER